VVLVLSRKRNEKIVIGDEITVTILEVRGDQVQLGIDAPRRIPVHRFEVYESIRRAAGESAPPASDPGDGPSTSGADSGAPKETEDGESPAKDGRSPGSTRE
jgi:carbon storage regulator